MTNDLTAQHLEAIGKANYKFGDLMITDNDKAATSCAAITVEWMKGLLEFIERTDFNKDEYTPDELINLYLKSLQTHKP